MPRENDCTRAHGLSQFVAIALSLIALVAPVYADTTTFAIDPQDLSGALKAFAVQSHREIFFAPELARGRRSKGVKGKYDDLRALNIILDGTGLDFSVTTSNAILVRDPTSKGDFSRTAITPSTSANKDPADSAIRVTQAESRQTQNSETANLPSSAPSVTSGSEKSGLSEIIVTAQKKSERLQDVPVPVTLINADALVANNELRLQDYYTEIPGVDLTVGNRGETFVSIRGLNTGTYTQPTVGVVVDDIPYGSSVGNGAGYSTPDIDPSDLASIEVLRGPQGTLYGASSIGGLIKYTTQAPSTDSVAGFMQAGLSSVYNGAEAGYNVRGNINVPLSDTVAVRASGYTRQDPGYIDDPILQIKGVNKAETNGGHLALLWRPSDVFTLKLSALIQRSKEDGSPDVTTGPGLGDLQQSFLPNIGGFDKTLQVYSATETAKLGSMDLTVLTGYSHDQKFTSLDFTSAFAECTLNGCGTGFQGFGVTGTPYYENDHTTKISQEIRLSDSIGHTIEWLVGGFYTHENTQNNETILASDTDGSVVGSWWYARANTAFQEYAAFGYVTTHITDRFDVQLGARESEIKNTNSPGTINVGPYNIYFLGEPTPSFGTVYSANENAFTYLVTPRFRISPNFMLYARLASGYEPGGINGNFTTAPTYNPSQTRNYEIGTKGEFFGHTLSFDASVYYIDWRNIQIDVYDEKQQHDYETNGAGAKSEGVELTIDVRPVEGLRIAASGTYDDAALTQPFPPDAVAAGTYGVPGDRLPFSSRFAGNLSLEQQFALTSEVVGFLGGAESYVGNRLGNFQASPQRQYYPGYAKTDLHAGAKYGSWTARLYVSNALDRRGLLYGGLDNFPANGFLYITPRTIGASVSKTF